MRNFQNLRSDEARSTPHARGKMRMPGTRTIWRVKQSPGLNLLPLTSGIYRTRIEVRTKIETVKRGSMKDKQRKRVEVTIILQDCSNTLVIGN